MSLAAVTQVKKKAWLVAATRSCAMQRSMVSVQGLDPGARKIAAHRSVYINLNIGLASANVSCIRLAKLLGPIRP